MDDGHNSLPVSSGAQKEINKSLLILLQIYHKQHPNVHHSQRLMEHCA